MAIINRIGDFQDEMTAWRRDLHAHPELAFEERRTAAFVTDKLHSFGFDEVHTGIAQTGVVGVLRAGGSGRAIGGLGGAIGRGLGRGGVRARLLEHGAILLAHLGTSRHQDSHAHDHRADAKTPCKHSHRTLFLVING